MESDDAEEAAPTDATISLNVAQLIAFRRLSPHGIPSEPWDVATTVIDFAAALLAAYPKPQVRPMRHAVLAALLRRAVITAEAVRLQLEAGLLEPATAAARTLLDIELSMRLIHKDDTDRMALRLAAYHYYSYKQHRKG